MKLQNTISIPKSKQRGAVLLVSMIMLLLLTVIGTAAMNLGSLDTKMTANARDRQVAFKAAESGLREAETRVSDSDNLPESGVTLGYNPTPITDQQWWSTIADTWSNTNSDLFDDYNGGTAPRFVIEYNDYVNAGDLASNGVSGSPEVGSGSAVDEAKILYYKLTSRGMGRAGSEVMLQSVYAVKSYAPPL